jgi:hypothetical protein
VTPSPAGIPQVAEAPRDFWNTWIGDATQTEWAISAPDRRLIQPITHYDTGIRPLNYLLNKFVFPLLNVLVFAENVVVGDFLGLSDLLEQAKSSDPFVQGALNMMPLQGAMGLTMEIGPALDWVSAWASTALRTSALGSNSPFWLLMGAGGVGGGSLGSVPSTASVSRTQVAEDLVQGLEEAGFRASARGLEAWTTRQIEAMKEYRAAYDKAWAEGAGYAGAARKGGQAVHSLFGAGEVGEHGPDLYYFGYVAEIKTSVGAPGIPSIIRWMQTAERYDPGTPAVVHLFDMLNGVKYFIQRQY